ncbi:probable mannan synthase 7, partial [Phalaenopsis equestris]
MEGANNLSLPISLVRAYEYVHVPMNKLSTHIWMTLSWMREVVILPTIKAIFVALLWMREVVVLPVMKVVLAACLTMLVLVMIEKMTMGFVSLYAKIFRRKAEKIYKCDPIEDDEELGSLVYPMVLVQIPMYNEKE